MEQTQAAKSEASELCNLPPADSKDTNEQKSVRCNGDRTQRIDQLKLDIESFEFAPQVTAAMRTYRLPHTDVKRAFESLKKSGVLRLSKGRYYRIESD